MTTKEQIRSLSLSEDIHVQYFLPVLRRLCEQEDAMTQEEIMDWAKKIHPVLRGKDIKKVGLGPKYLYTPKLWWSAPCPIHRNSFAYNSKAVERACGLKEIGRLTTYHRYGGYYGFLRPSLDEAIIQCPKDWLPQVCAVEFQTLTLDCAKIYNSVIDRHVLTTVYYKGYVPPAIAAQPVEW